MYDKVQKYQKTPYVQSDQFLVIAGPCAVEDEQTMLLIAKKLLAMGITHMRAGAYKPRTSPYSFQGLEAKGLEILKRIKEETGIAIVSEIIEAEQIPSYLEVVDIFQVGARNMQNFGLLKALGKIDKPILLKRSFGATVDEWLYACEHILVAGNENVILCERGIKTFETSTRTTLDISSIPIVKEKTTIPILIDPSHSSGKRNIVLPLARAAIAVGADGVMIEAHINPKAALSDQEETLDLVQLEMVLDELHKIARVMRKKLI